MGIAYGFDRDADYSLDHDEYDLSIKGVSISRWSVRVELNTRHELKDGWAISPSVGIEKDIYNQMKAANSFYSDTKSHQTVTTKGERGWGSDVGIKVSKRLASGKEIGITPFYKWHSTDYQHEDSVVKNTKTQTTSAQ